MSKRLLDCTASEIRRFDKAQLLDSIAGCEGRVLACETIGITQPLLGDITNAEYAASLGADILLIITAESLLQLVRKKFLNQTEITGQS